MPRNKKPAATDNVVPFPASLAAPAVVTQGVRFDIGADPSMFTVDQLRSVIDRFPGDALVRIGFFESKTKRPEIYPMTRLVCALVNEDGVNKAGEIVETKIPALVFAFDADVMPQEFPGAHDGNDDDALALA